MNHRMVRPVALVTGASSGIGYELAKQFAQHGYDLLVVAEDDGIRAAAEALSASTGANVQPVQVDLSTYDGVESLCANFEHRPLEAVALNAGVGVHGDFARETKLEDELKLIQLNVISVVHLAKRVTRQMVQRGRGRILIVSSIAGTLPAALTAVYGASRAFVLSFSEAIRHELSDTGITVTALLPGPTETNFFHRAHMEHTRVGQKEKDDPAQVAKDGFEALMAGKDKVVAGSFSNKVQTYVGRVIPDRLKAALHKRLAEPLEPEPTHH